MTYFWLQNDLEHQETLKCWPCGAEVEIEFLDTTLWDEDRKVCEMCSNELMKEEERNERASSIN